MGVSSTPSRTRSCIIPNDHAFSRRAARIAGALLLPAAIASIALRNEIPGWRLGGANAVLHPPLASAGTFPIRIDSHGTIVLLGDSNVSGSRVGGRDVAFPALLDVPRTAGIDVVNLGRGGGTVPDRVMATSASVPPQLVIIMFGTNDAAPRWILGRQKVVAPDLYAARLTATVRSHAEQGAKVLVLASPPAGSVAMDRRIAPYRLAARNVALQAGAHFADPAEAFAATRMTADLQYDGLHLSVAGQERLARWLDQLLAAS